MGDLASALPSAVGVVGLGSMGGALASRLLDSGVQVAGYNRTAARAVPFGVRGGRVLQSPADVARQAQLVVTCVTDESALGEVLLGPDGVLAGCAPGTILLETSTISPAASATFDGPCAEAGVWYLRAPISGSAALGAAGKIDFLVSGPRESFDAARPVLDVLARRSFYLGPREEARYQKIAILLVVGATMAALSEALTLGEKAGLDWRSMLEVFDNTAVASPLVRNKVPSLSERDFGGGAATRLVAKDFDLILGTGRQTGTLLPVAGLVRQLLGAVQSAGGDDLDFSALVLLYERLAGLGNPAGSVGPGDIRP